MSALPEIGTDERDEMERADIERAGVLLEQHESINFALAALFGEVGFERMQHVEQVWIGRILP